MATDNLSSASKNLGNVSTAFWWIYSHEPQTGEPPRPALSRGEGARHLFPGPHLPSLVKGPGRTAWLLASADPHSQSLVLPRVASPCLYFQLNVDPWPPSRHLPRVGVAPAVGRVHEDSQVGLGFRGRFWTLPSPEAWVPGAGGQSGGHGPGK